MHNSHPKTDLVHGGVADEVAEELALASESSSRPPSTTLYVRLLRLVKQTHNLMALNKVSDTLGSKLAQHWQTR